MSQAAMKNGNVLSLECLFRERPSVVSAEYTKLVCVDMASFGIF